MNRSILEKAIAKAIDGGWAVINPDIQAKEAMAILEWYNDFQEYTDESTSYKLFIFNHDFAKALWGTEPSETISFNYHSASDTAKSPLIGGGTLPLYLHHLQEMVVSGDPIKYLGDNI